MIRIAFVENFPIDGEVYAIFKVGGEYAFAWGPDFSYEDDLPNANIVEDNSGLIWCRSEDEAREAMLAAVMESEQVVLGELLPSISA